MGIRPHTSRNRCISARRVPATAGLATLTRRHAFSSRDPSEPPALDDDSIPQYPDALGLFDGPAPGFALRRSDRPDDVLAVCARRILSSESSESKSSLSPAFVPLRRTRAGPILAQFSDWLDVQHRSVTPKSLFGQAAAYSRNQWASLVRYLGDARFDIDNGAAERAIRPLAIGRANWLQIGGDAGLKTASVLLSVCASASRHRLNPWSYLRDVPDQIAGRSAGTELGDLLPDNWAIRRAAVTPA